LRVVAPNERPLAPAKPETIAEAVNMDERALLVALRDKAAQEIDTGVPAAYLAPVMRQLREIDKAIRALDARDEQEAQRGGPAEDEAFDASAV
jgi:hypothetical protein